MATLPFIIFKGPSPTFRFIRDEKAGLLRDAIRSQCLTCSRHKKRKPGMKKTSTVRVNGKMIFKEHKLTIGLDLGDRCSFYCVLDDAGKIILEVAGS
jgi:hypothetical protein